MVDSLEKEEIKRGKNWYEPRFLDIETRFLYD